MGGRPAVLTLRPPAPVRGSPRTRGALARCDFIDRRHQHDIALPAHAQPLGAQDDVERLVPGHILQAHGDLAAVAEAVRASGVPVDEIALRRPTLDDAFLALTGQTGSAGVPEDGDLVEVAS